MAYKLSSLGLCKMLTKIKMLYRMYNTKKTCPTFPHAFVGLAINKYGFMVEKARFHRGIHNIQRTIVRCCA